MRRYLIFSLVLLLGASATAGNIASGFDAFKTQPSSHWDFLAAPIAADFFGPGSDPFDGAVYIICDTSAFRPADADFVSGAAQTVPVEIVSMSLRSVEPIRVTNAGLPDSFFDVFITLDSAVPSGGQYSLMHNDVIGGEPDGGMMMIDSFFDVSYQMDFIDVATGDVRTLQRHQILNLVTPVPWAHTAPPPYDHGLTGGFFPGVDPFAEPLPDDYVPLILHFQGDQLTWDIQLARIPEPATLTLLALGAAALHRRRR